MIRFLPLLVYSVCLEFVLFDLCFLEGCLRSLGQSSVWGKNLYLYFTAGCLELAQGQSHKRVK